jgi:DNA topoisomerase-1
MMLAQQLYEGVDLGSEGTTGLITYMRTDSTRLSDDIVADARKFINDKYSSNYLPEKPKSYEKQNKKNVQDAHEAIRPTSLKYTPEFVKEYLDDAQFKIYDLIWKRFIACQMESAKLETTSINITADEYTFRTSGTTILFDGFQILYDESNDDTSDKGENGSYQIPAGLEIYQKMGLKEVTSNQHFTKPPARFTESTLIKELEINGIGRPSTYAMIMGTIVDRGYVQQQDRKLFPTTLGMKVNTVLVKNFPDIINVNFTAQMEEELDLIANGETEYLTVLNDFYGPFIKDLNEVEANLEKIICEKCGGELELKIGRFGKYFACNSYPECKNIKSLKEIAGGSNEPEYTGEECPKCSSKTVYREGKFGKFIGCEKYPDCDFTKVITLGLNCPKCSEGEIITRRTKRGKIFYGCNKYPDCDYASWTMPKPNEELEEQVNSSEDDY